MAADRDEKPADRLTETHGAVSFLRLAKVFHWPQPERPDEVESVRQAIMRTIEHRIAALSDAEVRRRLTAEGLRDQTLAGLAMLTTYVVPRTQEERVTCECARLLVERMVSLIALSPK
jgi:hypothetical protein